MKFEIAKKHHPDAPAHKGGAVLPVRLELAAIGMESEFSLVVDGDPVRPESLFRDPRDFIRQALVHRTGTSYHIPTGGAVYFDTGVIEVATPVIEIEPGCAARAGRSLWESIRFLREELDAWQVRTGHDARLVGFSTHYNVSFDIPDDRRNGGRTVDKLALLLAYILPLPVMMLAANKRSTGIGVRPRNERIEVTADFTPSASLMIAAGALIAGIVREVMQWPDYEPSMLRSKGVPVIQKFAPMPHTSRKGWLARYGCFPFNPFQTPPDQAVWPVEDKEGLYSLRELAWAITSPFLPAIRRLAGPFTYRMLVRVLRGRAPSLLDLPDRPEAYEDVGRLCMWDDLFPEHMLSRSRYERVLIRAISGRKLTLGGYKYTPKGFRGWAEVVFSRDADGTERSFPIDYLVSHLDRWERQ